MKTVRAATKTLLRGHVLIRLFTVAKKLLLTLLTQQAKCTVLFFKQRLYEFGGNPSFLFTKKGLLAKRDVPGLGVHFYCQRKFGADDHRRVVVVGSDAGQRLVNTL